MFIPSKWKLSFSKKFCRQFFAVTFLKTLLSSLILFNKFAHKAIHAISFLRPSFKGNKRCLRSSKNPQKISLKMDLINRAAPFLVTFLGDCFCQEAFFVRRPQPQRMFLSTLVILNILRQTLNCLRIALHGDS